MDLIRFHDRTLHTTDPALIVYNPDYRDGMLHLLLANDTASRRIPDLLWLGSDPTTIPHCVRPLRAHEQALVYNQKEHVTPGE